MDGELYFNSRSGACEGYTEGVYHFLRVSKDAMTPDCPILRSRRNIPPCRALAARECRLGSPPAVRRVESSISWWRKLEYRR
jgi:hypothetical protein